MIGVESVPVEVDGTTFYVEIADRQGVETVGLEEALSFDGVRDTIAALAGELKRAWERAQPEEATIAFGLKLSAKSGKLTGLLVEGGGEASLTVTLTWKRSGGPATPSAG